MNLLKKVWATCSDKENLKAVAKFLGFAALVSTNPATAAKLAMSSKVVESISEKEDEGKEEKETQDNG